MTKLGDSIIIATMFDHILSANPDVHLQCIGGEALAWFTTLLGDRVQIIPVDQEPKGPLDALIVFRGIKFKHFLMARKTGAVRFIAERRGFWSFLVGHHIPRRRPTTEHQLHIWGEYFEAEFPNLSWPKEYLDIRPLVGDSTPRRDKLLIHLHSQGSNRAPSLNVMRDIVAIASDSGVPTSLLSQGQSEIADQLIREIPDLQVLIPKSLPQLADHLFHARALVCADTGPVHLAAALRTPVLDLFCKHFTLPERWAPFGNGHTFLKSTTPCPRCLKRGRCERAPFSSDDCTHGFSTDTLTQAITELMSRQK